MKKEYIILALSSILSILVALFAFSYFFPHLTGRPSDMEIVQLSTKLPPFLESIFRREDITSDKLILKDPITNVRGKPLYPELKRLGPHDILGFRNRAVPNIADIVTIGDSQTYGINALEGESWPGVIAQAIRPLTVYNMALGGFSAPQYLTLFEKALLLKPQVIVLAFYSGNDPLESFITSYSIDYWKHLRPTETLKVTDGPKIVFPAPQEEWWPVTFQDGTKTVFTPQLRLNSHLFDHKAIQAGYEIVFDVLQKISDMAKQAETPVVVTMIPTKELAYLSKVIFNKSIQTSAYQKLIRAESAFIKSFQNRAANLDQFTYVNLVPSLQEGVIANKWIYPPDKDGHPLPAGYDLIAKTLFPTIAKHIKKLGDGFYKVDVNESTTWYYALKDNKRQLFTSRESAQATGLSPEKAVQTTLRHLEPYPVVRSY